MTNRCCMPVRIFEFQRFRIFPVASPSRHLRLVADRRERRTTPDAPNVGTVPPAHATDSPAFRPLHSISLQLRRSPVRLAPAFPFHCVPTATNCRDSQEINRARPKNQNGRETSSGQQAIARESLLAGRWVQAPPANTARGSACRRGQAIAPRGFARCKTSAITVSTAIFRPLHSAGAPFRRSERWPTSLTNPNWSDTPLLGCMAVCRDFPFTLSSHSLPFRSTTGESERWGAHSVARRW
jgi:hypothetical protein